MPYQAPPSKIYVPTSSYPPADVRMPPSTTFMGHREPPANLDGPSSSARREKGFKEPVQLSSGNSQSGSDEQLPSSSNSYVEVTFLCTYFHNQDIDFEFKVVVS